MEGSMSGGGDASVSSGGVPSSFGGGGSSSPSPSSGGGSGAAPANDNGKGLGDGARDPASGQGAPSEANPEKPKWYREKAKLKHGGQEREITVEEALSMLSDDYDHPVTVSGEERKVKRDELIRGYQKSGGAEQLMRKAAEQRKALEDQIAYGRENPQWVLENVLNVGDHEEWAINVVKQRIQRERELAELYEANPLEHSNRMMKLAEERLARKTAYEQRQREQAEQQRISQERMRELDAKATAAAKAVGLPLTAQTRAVIGQLWNKYRELGYEAPIEEIIHEAKQEYVREVFGFIDQHDDDKLLELLGNDRRKRLRELELRKVGNGASNGKQQRAESESREPAPKKVREITEAEFMKSVRRS